MDRFGMLASRPSRCRLVALMAVLAMVSPAQAAMATSGSAAAPAKSVPDRGRLIAAEQSRSAFAAQELGLGSGEKLVVKDVITDADGSTHVRYNRTFDGLRVIGGDFVSHRGKTGALKSVSWNTSQNVAVASTTAKVALASARATGARKASSVQKSTSATKGEKVVYAGGATPKLAYDVLTLGVRPDQTPSRLHTIVDANTGATLESFDEIAPGNGHGIRSGKVTIGTKAGPPWSMHDAVGNYTTDLKGSYDDDRTNPGTTFTDADDIWGNGLASDRASVAVDAQYGAAKTFDYFKTLGRNGIWNNGVGARSRVHFGDEYGNAFWDGKQMTYGDGWGNADPLVTMDITAHEMSHGVTENTADLIYNAQDSGGLNEATSDIFGTAVEWFANNASDTPDYLLGEKVDLFGDGEPLRYMDRPSRDGVSLDCWTPAISNRGIDPHYSSGPLNHWFYLASEGSGAKVINGVSYDSSTCNVSTVSPIGRDKAARIWYRTLSTYLSSSSTYAAAREGAIQSAKDLYGIGSPECRGVAASFSAILVPPGGQICDSTPPPPLGSNLLSNPGFESGDSLWASTSRVIGQWGSTTPPVPPLPPLPPQPAHAGTWSAWMGGHGMLQHESISQLVTIPATRSATLSYYVHIDTGNSRHNALDPDAMTVRVGSMVLQTLTDRNAAPGFQRKTVDLSAYVGQTIALSFHGSQDEVESISTFVLDDLSVTASAVAVAPGEPTAVKATPGDTQAGVSWTAQGNGGSPITGYKVRVVNAAGVQVGALRPAAAGATSLNVTGLVNGTDLRFQVQASTVVGSSAFSDLSLAVTPTVAVTRLSDFNQDGRTDLVARDKAGTPWLYAGNGAGGFLTRTGMDKGWSTFTAIVTPGDVTGDGTGDVLARTTAGQLWLYPGYDGGELLSRKSMGFGYNGMTALTAAGDMTGDGRPDVLARDSAGRLWLYPVVGTGVFGSRRLVAPGGWSSMTAITGAGDLTGDRRADVLARDSAGKLWIYPGNGNGLLGGRISAGSGWNGMTALVTPGNWDRAGGNDLIARDAAGKLWLYPGNNAGKFTARRQIGAGFGSYTIA